LHITGYGVLVVRDQRFQLSEAGVVRGPARGEFARRIQTIHDGICEVIESCRPTVLALEELYSHYQRPRTAILMGHARGVICLAAATRSIPVIGYSATQVKRILTGSGRAPKSQIQQAIQRELNLPQLPQPADVADALAIALCHFYLAGRQTRNGMDSGNDQRISGVGMRPGTRRQPAADGLPRSHLIAEDHSAAEKPLTPSPSLRKPAS
jgi:crossover junction endodeoxyribonuclease RuvC